MAEFDWTKPVKARLEELWREVGANGKPRYTTAAIGDILGCTKNAVVGKVHRLCLPSRPSPLKGVSLKPRLPPKPKPVPLAPIVAWSPPAPSPPTPAAEATRQPLGFVEAAPPPHVSDATTSQDDIRTIIVGDSSADAKPAKPSPPTGSCCFPLWGATRPTHRYCGKPRKQASPYCAAHHEQSHIRIRDPHGNYAPIAGMNV